MESVIPVVKIEEEITKCEIFQTLSVKPSKEKHSSIGNQDGFLIVFELLNLLALVHGINTGIDDVIPLVSRLDSLSVSLLDDIREKICRLQW